MDRRAARPASYHLTGAGPADINTPNVLEAQAVQRAGRALRMFRKLRAAIGLVLSR